MEKSCIIENAENLVCYIACKSEQDNNQLFKGVSPL